MIKGLAVRQTNRPIHRLNYQRTSRRQTNNLTHRPNDHRVRWKTDKQADTQTKWSKGYRSDRHTDRPADWIINGLATDRQTIRPTDRMIKGFAASQTASFTFRYWTVVLFWTLQKTQTVTNDSKFKGSRTSHSEDHKSFLANQIPKTCTSDRLAIKPCIF